MMTDHELADCLGLLHSADLLLTDCGEGMMSAHLSLVIALLSQRLPPAG